MENTKQLTVEEIKSVITNFKSVHNILDNLGSGRKYYELIVAIYGASVGFYRCVNISFTKRDLLKACKEILNYNDDEEYSEEDCKVIDVKKYLEELGFDITKFIKERIK